MSGKVDRLDTIQSRAEVDAKDCDTTTMVAENEAFNQAMLKEPPQAWTRGQVMLYLFSVVAFICPAMNGYDGSLINNLLQNPSFLRQFNVGNAGTGAGIVVAIYQIGGAVALPLVGPVMDGWGRRVGMGLGALIVIAGTVIQGTSRERGQFMAGRFLLGLGVSFASAAGPTYVVELNHPAYRGVVGAMYNTLWFAGAILASGAARASIDDSWRLDVWLQSLFSAIIAIFYLFLPESPRWLYVHGRKDEAKL